MGSGQGAHERLEVHHEAAVAGDAVDALLLEVGDRLLEAPLDDTARSHAPLAAVSARLGHLEREARHHTVEHLVWMVGV